MENKIDFKEELLEGQLVYQDLLSVKGAEEGERFKIKDLSGADWVFRKIKQAKDKYQEKENYANQQIFYYQQYLKDEEEKLNNEIQYFEFLIKEYFEEERAKDPKFKLNTPVGKVSTRKSKKWNYEDDKVLNFLKENNLFDYIRIKEEVNKADLKKSLNVSDNGQAVTSDGEVIPGITVEETETVTVKVD